MLKLKQDVLCLMNIAFAGTACSQILSLFKFTFGCLESKESKGRGKQLEEMETISTLIMSCLERRIQFPRNKMKRKQLTSWQMLTLNKNQRSIGLESFEMS